MRRFCAGRVARSLPAEEAIERFVVEVALPRRRNLDLSRALMELMAASPTSPRRAQYAVVEHAHASVREGCLVMWATPHGQLGGRCLVMLMLLLLHVPVRRGKDPNSNAYGTAQQNPRGATRAVHLFMSPVVLPIADQTRLHHVSRPSYPRPWYESSTTYTPIQSPIRYPYTVHTRHMQVYLDPKPGPVVLSLCIVFFCISPHSSCTVGEKLDTYLTQKLGFLFATCG